jgi:hypothetical protein
MVPLGCRPLRPLLLDLELPQDLPVPLIRYQNCLLDLELLLGLLDQLSLAHLFQRGLEFPARQLRQSHPLFPLHPAHQLHRLHRVFLEHLLDPQSLVYLELQKALVLRPNPEDLRDPEDPPVQPGLAILEFLVRRERQRLPHRQ